MGAQFQPCLCLLGALATITLLLMCVSHPSLIDIQQCVRVMPLEFSENPNTSRCCDGESSANSYLNVSFIFIVYCNFNLGERTKSSSILHYVKYSPGEKAQRSERMKSFKKVLNSFLFVNLSFYSKQFKNS